MATDRRGLQLPRRLSILQQADRGEGVRARRQSRDSRRAVERWARLRADEPLDRIRPPFRRDCGTGAAGWSDARGAVRLSPGRDLDHCRCRARRRCSGLRHPRLVDSAQWKVARTDGEGGDRASGGIHGARRRVGNHGGAHRRARTRRRQRAAIQSVGHGDDRPDDSDRDVHGCLSAVDPPRSRARGQRDRYRSARCRALRGPLGRGESRMGASPSR